MRPETLLKRFKTFCIICTRRISRQRQRRRAITCGAVHQKLLTKLRKIERDHRLCSVCGKPSTPDERRQFRAFRASLNGDAPRKRGPKKVSPTGLRAIADIAEYVPKVRRRKKARGAAA